MKIIAIEEHIHTRAFVEYLYAREEYPRRDYTEINGKKMIRDWWTPDKYRLMDPDKPDHLSAEVSDRVRAMNEIGIDRQVLSLSFPGVELFNQSDGTMMSRKVNDDIYAITQQYPDRFSGLATLAPQSPDEAAAELHRAVKELGMAGAMVNGNINGEFLDQEKFWPIFKMAEQLDVPIYIHPKMPPADMIKPYLVYPGLAAAMAGFAAEASLHATRLIVSGVFDQHPNLKIILGHLGEALPFWLWRLDSRLEEEKGDPASAAFYKNLKKRPSEYFRDNFYVTMSGMYWKPVLEFVVSVLGPDKVLFATDYPYEDTKQAVDFVKSMPLAETEMNQICQTNAEHLLKL